MENSGFIPDFTKAFQKEFYLQDTIKIAQMLLGNVLVRRLESGEYLAARIVEVEAYLDTGDLSSHSAPGITKRNQAMFEDGGIIYIYKIYGIHLCMNIVTGKAGNGCAVLIRAAEPLLGADQMMKFRNSQNITSLCKGPGNLAKAFGLTIADNRRTLAANDFFVQNTQPGIHTSLAASKRIGITKSSELELRFYIENNPYVSGPKNAGKAR